MWKEFKTFAVKGNMLDLAIGVIIGAAFGKIVSSLVNDIIMPIIGLMLGGIDLTALSIPLGDADLMYGAFLQTLIDFFIIAFSIFLFIKFLNKFKKKEEEKAPEAPTPTKEEILLTEIRDLLKERQ